MTAQGRWLIGVLLAGAAALWLLLTGPVELFGFDGGQAGMLKLQWARPFVIADLWVFALMWGWLCEYAATALMYWRDHR